MLRHFKADFFKTLAHASRIRIVDALRDGEMTVGDLQDELKMEQSSVSQHLAILRSRDFVQARREGTSVYYSVSDPAICDRTDDHENDAHDKIPPLVVQKAPVATQSVPAVAG
jgi:DNA-binding transcriptional ArsR family regulator